MQIVEYFTTDKKEHWLNEIKKCDWVAGQFLYQLLNEGKLKETVGETALVPMLVEGDKLISFCTLAPLDDIKPTEFSPWVGFVYTFPEYRGRHYAGELLNFSEGIAAIMGKDAIYISTNHTGLYEKYGYQFFRMEKDIGGEDSRIYRKNLKQEGTERERLLKEGNINKGKIVTAAKKEINPIAYCGFSCNHCFLGEWCGGCRSVFSCCSFGTLFENGKCPNRECCEKKEIEGCYECTELENCRKGFYADGNEGAIACKSQALFIKKHGNEKFISVHNKLKPEYEADKLQKILDDDINKSLEFLERYL